MMLEASTAAMSSAKRKLVLAGSASAPRRVPAEPGAVGPGLAGSARAGTDVVFAMRSSVLVGAASRAVQPRIAQSLKNIRAYDGQRLPADDWHIVRSIVLERDGHACVYCGADKPLEGDHIVPLSQGGSNALTNLATACRPCNLSKASSTLEEWCVRRAAAVPMRRGNRQRRIR